MGVEHCLLPWQQAAGGAEDNVPTLALILEWELGSRQLPRAEVQGVKQLPQRQDNSPSPRSPGLIPVLPANQGLAPKGA